MKPLFILLTLLAIGLGTESAQAQVRWYRGPVNPVRVGIGYGLGYYGPYYGGGYSPVEGYQRGMADVIRARGQAASDVARARIDNETARSKYLDNKLKWTEIYWQRKRLGEAELAKDYDKMRARRDAYLAAKRDRQAEILAPSQLDMQSGAVEWPESLQGPAYAELRMQIEDELQLQADTGSMSNAGKIRILARQMQNILKDHIKEMQPNEYIAARKFLDRLVNQMALAQAS